MRDHGGGGCVFDLGVGHHADRKVEPALDQAGDGLDPRIVERVFGAVGIDAQGVDRRLVAGRIGARGIGQVGDDRVAAGRRHQRHVRHVVDREFALCLALRDALGEDAGGDAVGERHAVADEQDDVLRLARPGVEDVPGDLARFRAVGHFDLVGAGLHQRHIAQRAAPTGPCRPRVRRRSRPCRTPWRSLRRSPSR